MVFVCCEDKYLIKKQVKKLIDKIENNNEYEIFEYSLIDDNLTKIYEEINTYSLFSNKKIIIINDCWFVNQEKVKLHDSYNSNLMEKILKSSNENVQLILTVNSVNLAKNNKNVKYLQDHGKILKINNFKIEEKKQILIKKLNDNNIEYDIQAIDDFLDKIPEDLQVFFNEIDKLITLNQKITCNLIEQIIYKYNIYDVFQITNSLISNNLNLFLKHYSNYIQVNNDLFSFIGLLANNLITLRNILLLKNDFTKNDQLASFLQINTYRITKLLSENKWNINQINDKIKILYTIESNIKKGIFDNKIIPELQFLLMFNSN